MKIDKDIETFRLRRNLEDIALMNGFLPIEIPVMIDEESIKGKLAGTNKQVYRLDNGNVLRPEATNIVSDWYKEHGQGKNDVKVFYFSKMFRKEKRQAGRYNEFYQFGMEWLNPKDEGSYGEMIRVAETMVRLISEEAITNFKVDRGADYYIDGKGFEIIDDSLGAQKQIVGGGKYDVGVGFAIGVERLLLTKLSTVEPKKK